MESLLCTYNECRKNLDGSAIVHSLPRIFVFWYKSQNFLQPAFGFLSYEILKKRRRIQYINFHIYTYKYIFLYKNIINKYKYNIFYYSRCFPDARQISNSKLTITRICIEYNETDKQLLSIDVFSDSLHQLKRYINTRSNKKIRVLFF